MAPTFLVPIVVAGHNAIFSHIHEKKEDRSPMPSRPQRASRLASLGLTLVLIVLTVSAIWATAVSQSLADDVRTSVEHSNLYIAARFALTREAALQSEYWQQPDPAVR